MFAVGTTKYRSYEISEPLRIARKRMALEIEAGGQLRLADEYDAAQERGEVTTRADQNLLPNGKKARASDVGLTHKEIHEARQIRDAEVADPGIVRRTVDAAVKAGKEPTKARVKRASPEDT